MSRVTLGLIKAKQAEMAAMQTQLGAMIDQLDQTSKTTKIVVLSFELDLRCGEWYAGDILKEDGSVEHRLIASIVADKERNFDDTQAWAASEGLSAPTIRECRLIVANKGSRLQGISTIWTCERHENPAYAWCCFLITGDVSLNHRRASAGGVAVRRVSP